MLKPGSEIKPPTLVEYFLWHVGITKLRMGFEPLRDLICMYYEHRLPIGRSPYAVLEERYHAKRHNIISPISRALERVYPYCPILFEEIVMHSLDRAPPNMEFVRGAARWLDEHKLIVTESGYPKWYELGRRL